MPILYKIITALLALTGCMSLAITGEINPVMSLSSLALIPGYYRFLKGEKPAHIFVIGALSVLTLLLFIFDSIYVSGDIFLAVAHLTMAFQALKSFDLKEPWDHLQVYFVSLLQLIVASELTNSLAFGAVFVFFLMMLVTAMVLSHFMKEGTIDKIQVRNPVIIISSLTIIVTMVFFVVLPRTSYRFLGKSHLRGTKTSGFSEQMDFGSLSSIKLDTTVIMRIELNRELKPPFYWRGHTLDFFDGTSWRNTQSGRRRIMRSNDEFVVVDYDRSQAVEQQIYLEPLDSEVLFGLDQVQGIRTDLYALFADSANNLYARGKTSRRIKYSAYSIPGKKYPGSADKAYLQLPPGTGRIDELARSITWNLRTAEAKTSAIEGYLRTNYTYSLSVDSPAAGVNPVEEFLFRSKKGYCEHYAAAMVIMLRSLGIPSRIATGFYGGENNEYGGYMIVRSSDAHSWVEAVVDGTWRRFDPTPAVVLKRPQTYSLFWDSIKMTWSRYVIGYSSSDQRRILAYLRPDMTFRDPAAVLIKKPGISVSGVYVLLLLLVLSGSMYLIMLRFARLKKYGALTSKYLKLRQALAKKGFRVTPSTTSGDLIIQAEEYRFSDDLRKFVVMYEAARFGKKDSDPALIRTADTLIRSISGKDT